MAKDGGLSTYPGNKAGAAYGVGYCDAQCPQDLKFINGQVCLPYQHERYVLTDG
jgi:cellulose 1,4-beta-cellobiosidase